MKVWKHVIIAILLIAVSDIIGLCVWSGYITGPFRDHLFIISSVVILICVLWLVTMAVYAIIGYPKNK
jgi:hypothetical protein